MGETNEPSQLEDTMEDVLGFNFRSLRTLRDILIRPNKVFRAYAAGDRVSYTPALRIWLGLMSIQFIVLAFNGGYGSIIGEQLSNNPEQLAELNSMAGGRGEFMFEKAGEAFGYLQVPIVGLFSALSVFALKPLEPTLSFPARLNITFAILSAGSVVGAISTLGGFGSALIMVLGMMSVFVMYFITFIRGGPDVLDQSSGGLLLKGAGFSIILLVLVLIASIVLGFVSGIYAGVMLGISG